MKVIYFVAFIFQCISIVTGDTDDIEITPEEFFAVKNSLNFCGKVVLISGSSSGIGAATARLLSYLGAQVVITGRNETRVKEVADDCWHLSPHQIKPLGIALDLTIPGNVAILINETIKSYDKIDVLVNCAGIGLFANIQDPNFNDVYSQVRAINEEAHVEMTRLAAPYILNANGAIIFIASRLARNPTESTGAYSMAKNSLKAIAKTLAHDLGQNVRVNVISPGMVDGTRVFRLLPPSTRANSISTTIASTTLHRPAIPLDIAKAIVFLASPLSNYVDGKELQLDGGAFIPVF
ncbi:3-oxoacyl-[acyl-carrier-protein] reductase FabG [Pseudolycoriella hygida]|uniref:3-oxoacyl-[acyl-carrier-protein] reductase FabG n=1 Tax=Pseudolycoriella hygida TaxID=35572 RepID=A0A9Q0MX90_9DIPT|nr:3-oxoacyl-[acyl-carrier-protein] reductase FabG [Pseudolycoriella hygida]